MLVLYFYGGLTPYVSQCVSLYTSIVLALFLALIFYQGLKLVAFGATEALGIIFYFPSAVLRLDGSAI